MFRLQKHIDAETRQDCTEKDVKRQSQSRSQDFVYSWPRADPASMIKYKNCGFFSLLLPKLQKILWHNKMTLIIVSNYHFLPPTKFCFCLDNSVQEEEKFRMNISFAFTQLKVLQTYLLR